MASFVQIQPDDWEPGPYGEIAVISPLPGELHEVQNIQFHEIMQDLGLMDIALIETPDGARYMLKRYRECPGLGTEIWGFEDAPNISQLVNSLLKHLGLDQSELLWVADEKSTEP